MTFRIQDQPALNVNDLSAALYVPLLNGAQYDAGEIKSRSTRIADGFADLVDRRINRATRSSTSSQVIALERSPEFVDGRMLSDYL